MGFGSKAANYMLGDSAKQEVLPAQSVNNNADSDKKPVEAPPVFDPQSLRIPTINVDTTVESAGIDSERKPVLPKDADNVVWYNLGAKPGEMGSSVMAGHWDKITGEAAVFYDLNKLNEGDKIYVTDLEGKERTFSVTKKVDYPHDEVPLQEIYAGSRDAARLNLITCGGTWNAATQLYSHRTVVYSELVE